MSILSVTKRITGSPQELPDPSSMKIILQDIDASSTTRSAKGLLLRDRVRGAGDAIRKIECSWAGLKMESAAELMQLVDEEFFEVSYPDIYTGERRTGTFYVGDRSCEFFKTSSDGENAIMSTVSMNFIER